MLGSLVLLVLIAALLATGPWWPHSRAWGYRPSSLVGLALLIWIFLAWFGWLTFVWPWGVAAPA